jgi:hypothetical protein
MDSPVAGYNFFGGSDISSLVSSAPNQDWQTDADAVKASMPPQEDVSNVNEGPYVNEGSKLQPYAQGFDPAQNPVSQTPPGSSPTPPQSFGDQPAPDNSAHPLLSDPRFKSLYQNDTSQNKTASQQLYSRVTGRKLQDDLKLQAAQAESSSKIDHTVISNLIEKDNLRFNSVTGEPEISVKDNPNFPEGVAPLKAVSPVQYQSLMRSYKQVTGNEIPQGIDVPRGLTPQEASSYRQRVFDLANQDQSNSSWDSKVENAKNKAYKEGWNAQQSAAAVAANPATENNTPGFLTRNITRAANMPIAAYNTIRNPVMNYGARTFGDNSFMRGAASMFPNFSPYGTQDVQTAAASLTSGVQGLQQTWADLPP